MISNQHHIDELKLLVIVTGCLPHTMGVQQLAWDI
jgi:hypothetical protein